MIEAWKILFLKRLLHRWILIKIKNWHNFIRIIHNLHVTFFTEEQNKFLWFLRDNNQRWRTSTQYFVFFFWICFDYCFCVLCWFILFLALTDFKPTRVSRNLIFFVSLGLRRFQLSDLTCRLAYWLLCGIQDADIIESGGRSYLKLVACLFIWLFAFNFFIWFIYLLKKL